MRVLKVRDQHLLHQSLLLPLLRCAVAVQITMKKTIAARAVVVQFLPAARLPLRFLQSLLHV